MKKINSKQLRQMWLDFYKQKGHALIGSASLIPENDPTVLFTTAGMHPLVPYLLGQKHPLGTRLANVQKCVRTGDIDEVGDATHLTFFEMLGNWSLGDYFKKEQIAWSFEFLTSEKYLGIPLDKLAFSVFEGEPGIPRDDESAKYWRDCGVSQDKIFFLPRRNNWWGPAGMTGPCGPDTEMFIDTGKTACSKDCSPACDCGKYIEIWNDVFMQYNKTNDGSFVPLSQKNVDTGMGLERTICILQGVKSVYESDIFKPFIACIEQATGKKYSDGGETMRAMRIISDHVRTAVFILGDIRGVTPGNVDQGYVLRRLIRRAVRFARQIEAKDDMIANLATLIIESYKDVYPEIFNAKDKVLSELELEQQRFLRTITAGLKEFEKAAKEIQGGIIDGRTAFRLYDTFGFPLEMTVELSKEKGFDVDVAGYQEAFREHQAKSHDGADGKFKGGLADASEETAKLHTATHLMLAALKKVLGDEVNQRGSNITADRLRFDFSFSRKMEDDEIKKVQDMVNEAIRSKAPITCEEMTVDQAKEAGATGIFESKYGEKVKVYTMGNFSKEICGGPHASNTGDLGEFEIQKEQSSSSGVRRIKAILKQQ